MITKAIINAQINEYQARVRIPLIDGAENDPGSVRDDLLLIANICYPPGIVVRYNPGDIVYVGFEDGNRSKPLILGKFRSPIELQSGKIEEDVTIFAKDINSYGDVKLGSSVSIGKVKPLDIASLTNIKDNIQYQIDEINKTIKE